MSKKISSAIFLIAMCSVTFVVLQQSAFAQTNLFLDLPIGLKIGETADIDSELKMTLLEVEDSRSYNFV